MSNHGVVDDTTSVAFFTVSWCPIPRRLVSSVHIISCAILSMASSSRIDITSTDELPTGDVMSIIGMAARVEGSSEIEVVVIVEGKSASGFCFSDARGNT